MNANTNFGATYNTESGEDFGKIISVFTVDATWDGHRFHGYCRPTPEEVAEFLGRWNEFHKAFICPFDFPIPAEAVEVYRGRMDVAYESNDGFWYRFNGSGTTEGSEMMYFPDKSQCKMHWAKYAA